jgi:D-aspartate ligase
MRNLCNATPSFQLNTSVPVVVLAAASSGHGIARSLGRLGIPVYGVYNDSLAAVAWSRYWQEIFIWDITTASPMESVAWLLQLGHKIGSRPLLIATSDDHCLFIADHATGLQEVFRFPHQPSGLARSVSDKQQMYALCKTYAIPTAETAFPQTRNDVLAYLAHARFPLMLKGIDTRALARRTGRSMVLVKDAKSLLQHYEAMETPEAPSLMLQEYIPGGSEMRWMFNGYFDETSKCLFGLTGQKLRESPSYGGMTSLGVCMANEVVARQTQEFMQAIGYRGIVDIDYKYDVRTGQYKVLDINPRIGASFRLFVDTSGMDVARALYRDLTGQPVVPGMAPEGRKWLVENYDIVSSFRYWHEGELGVWEWLHSFRGVEEASWFVWDDPMPFVMIGVHSLQRTLAMLHPRGRPKWARKLVKQAGRS